MQISILASRHIQPITLALTFQRVFRIDPSYVLRAVVQSTGHLAPLDPSLYADRSNTSKHFGPDH